MNRHCLLAAVLALIAAAAAQEFNPSETLSKQDVMIPMRDGVRLHAEIYAPKDSNQSLPFLITRTPYGTSPDDKGFSKLLGLYREMIPEGYIFVMEDIRGRFASEGKFVMNRPLCAAGEPKCIDENTDDYDTIDWLLKNVANNNGRVGELGISYGGWLTTMAMLRPHPALKAVSEQASPADQFLGDDFHHNGAFRLSYGFEYATMMETDKTNFHFKFDRYDTYEWYLALGPLSNVDKNYLHGTLPTWEDFVKHPNYDAFWQKLSFLPYLDAPTIPNLNVAGWYDQEDFYGPVTIYEKLEKKDTRHLNYLVAGPWNHGGWARLDAQKLGPVDFGSNTSRYFREKIQAPWFAYWLKDKGTLPVKEALTFRTGSNEWESYDAWPPKQSQPKKLYFREDGKLSFDAPTVAGEQFDSYISDPANPVPYRPRPVPPTYPSEEWRIWLVQDQRFVDHRPDVLTWQTEPLAEDVVVTGDIVANLFASTTGSDSDWIVKLIDVYPEEYKPEPKMGGYQLIIADEVFRGRFRNGFEQPQPLASNEVTRYRIDLHSNDHAFLKGHKIMVQVQSTWFPVIDRNPQKFVPNIFEAKASDFQKATQKVYRSRVFPSNIELPVISTSK